jgi:hypothetical protein
MEGAGAGMFLEDVHPDFVVVFDYDVELVRALECIAKGIGMVLANG